MYSTGAAAGADGPAVVVRRGPSGPNKISVPAEAKAPGKIRHRINRVERFMDTFLFL
jgi:hypothetical protein